MDAAAALQLARNARELYVAKGKQVVHLRLPQDAPDDATLIGLLVGPTGNLRAPTVRVGRTLLVGFDEGMYRKVLGTA